MTRNTHPPRRQRPTAQQMHEQHQRRATENRPFPSHPLPHRPLEQRITRGDAERSSLRRPPSSAAQQQQQQQQQSQQKKYRNYHDPDRPREPDWTREPLRLDVRAHDSRLTRTDDDDADASSRRPRATSSMATHLSDTFNSMALVRRNDPNPPPPPPPPAPQSMALVPRAATPAGPLHVAAVPQYMMQYQRAAERDRNRSMELTRLNRVMLQRNKAIADAREETAALQERLDGACAHIARLELAAMCGGGQPPQVEQEQQKKKERDVHARQLRDLQAQQQRQQQEETASLREKLARRTEMAVTLHCMAGRQQDFLKGAVEQGMYGQGEGAEEQRRMFRAWVQSNELYMAVAKGEIAAERDWDEVVEKAGKEALKEIGRAAMAAARETDMFRENVGGG